MVCHPILGGPAFAKSGAPLGLAGCQRVFGRRLFVGSLRAAKTSLMRKSLDGISGVQAFQYEGFHVFRIDYGVTVRPIVAMNLVFLEDSSEMTNR